MKEYCHHDITKAFQLVFLGKVYCEMCCGGAEKWDAIFLNQARAGHRPARAWFLKITSVRMYACVRACVCVCVCVCIRPRGYE